MVNEIFVIYYRPVRGDTQPKAPWRIVTARIFTNREHAEEQVDEWNSVPPRGYEYMFIQYIPSDNKEW